MPRSTAKSFDKPHAVSVHSAYFMDAPSNVPKDPRGEPYTEDVVRATARAHAFYGWAPNPGCMTLEQKQHINPLLMDALEEQQ